MADGAAPELKAGEVQLNVAALGAGDHAAADELTQLFLEEDSEIAGAGDAPAGDAEQAETPAIGDTETGQNEPGQAPAIEAPVSWTAEEKQEFAKLPPATQQAIARRESERERLISTQGQKATEEAQRLSAERQAVANDRAQQIQLFQSIILQTAPEFQRFQGIDWPKLAREQPAEWAAQKQSYDDLVGRMNAAQSQVVALTQHQQAESDRLRNEFVQAELPKLVAKFPDVADPVKAKDFGAKLSKYIPEITPDEWKGVIDHRQVLIARDAMRWREAVALREAARAKQVPAGQGNVRTLRPGARAPSGGADDAKGAKLKALHANLGKTNSTEAAVNLLTEVFR